MKITATADKLAKGYALQVENYIRLHIQPKPKWLPNFIWKRLLRRLLILETLESK